MRQACFAGYVGKDAELTYTQTGTAFCKFSIAANRGWQMQNESSECF